MPAFHRHRVGEEKREREKIRERRGKRRRREGKIRDPFVLGDMRMPEKEGTIVMEWTDRGGKGRVGGLWGKRRRERRVWASGVSGQG